MARNMTSVEKFFSDQIFEVIGRRINVFIENVPVQEIKEAGTKYERVIQQAILCRIKREFNGLVASLILMNVRPDGKKSRVDGHHRITAIMELGKTEWPCLVSYGLTEAEEAKMWNQSCYGRGNARPEFRLYAGLVEGKEECIAITDMLRKYGFKSPHPIYAARKGLTIAAISKIEQAYRYGVLSRVLSAISSAWPGNRDGVAGPIIHGLTTMLRLKEVKDSIDFDRFVKMLSDPRRGDPRRILGEAERRSSARGYIYLAVANELIDIYNYGLKNGKGRIKHEFSRFEHVAF